MTNQSRNEYLNAVIDANSPNIEHLNVCLNSVPTSSSLNSVHMSSVPTFSSADNARNIFLAESDILTDEELAEAAAFYDSPVGKKDRQVATEVVQRFEISAKTDEALSLPEIIQAKADKAAKIVAAHSIQETLESFKSNVPLSGDELTHLFVSAYSTYLTDDELDQILKFHTSPTGQKCVKVARTAGLKLSSRLGV